MLPVVLLLFGAHFSTHFHLFIALITIVLLARYLW